MTPHSDEKSPHPLCDLCGREGNGWGVRLSAVSEAPTYHACSDLCDDVLLDLVHAGKGFVLMADYTEMEKKAVIAARVQLWDALVAADPAGDTGPLPSSFATLSGEQIDRIIMAVWDGLRASMQKQSAVGDIPI